MSYRPAGSWCDVCVLPDGRIAFVRAEPSMVICEIDGVFAWGVLTPAPLLFVRCAALADGTVAAIGKANDPQGSALLILRDKVLPLGPTAGNNPVAITSTHAYIVTAPANAHRVSLDDGFAEPVPMPWVSTGIRDMIGDYVITADSTYAATIRGYNFGEYQQRGDLTVGQHGFGIGVLIGAQFFLARQGTTNYGPHGCQSGSRIAVCAYTEAGSYYQEFTPPYPSAPVVTPPAPVPVPQPAPAPEPKPVSIPNQLSTVQRVRAKYPTPLGAAHPLFLIEIAQATGAKLLKKDGGTHVTLPTGVNVSQDILVFNNGAECYDILGDGEGAATPGWGAKGAIAGTYIDVSGFGEVVAPPVVTPPAESGSDLAALRNEVATLSVKLAQADGRFEDALDALGALEGRVLALEHKPAPIYKATGSTSRAFGHGHTINVTLEPQA